VSLKTSIVVKTLLLSLVTVVVTSVAIAQNPTVVIRRANRPMAVAAGSNLYCAGYIQTSAISTGNRIVGAQDEADKYNYAEHDFV